MVDFVCYLCEEQYPTEFKNDHHKIPQAAGGDDKDIVHLCSGCHQTLHAIANVMKNPTKTGLVDDFIIRYFETPEQQVRCRDLAVLIVKYLSFKQEGLLDLSQVMITVPVPLSHIYHAALRTLANEHRDPDTGRRKMGMANYLSRLVKDHLQKAYPKLTTATTLSELLEEAPNKNINRLGLQQKHL